MIPSDDDRPDDSLVDAIVVGANRRSVELLVGIIGTELPYVHVQVSRHQPWWPDDLIAEYVVDYGPDWCRDSYEVLSRARAAFGEWDRRGHE